MPGFSTNALHADTGISTATDVAPAISVSNIFEYPENLDNGVNGDDAYSRCAQPNVSRCEAVLDALFGGHALAYANGVAAFHAVVMGVNPKRVFVDHAYYGILALLQKFKKNGYLEVYRLEEMDSKLQKGDLVHIENPMSPWGTALNVEYYTKKAHEKGALVCVDSTVAPPPLSDPFKRGADIIVHSGSKYLGGHSDVLCGVVVTKDKAFKSQLYEERIDLGTILPTFQAWLLLRSMRTLSLRVKQQASNANQLVKFLSENQHKFSKLDKIYHASLQNDDFVKKELPLVGPAIFGIETTDEKAASELPNKLKLFVHATSMGGVESSIEWRALSDSSVSRCLLRVSVGIEDAEDLMEDFANALK